MDGDLDFGAVTGEVFVNRVVEHFEDTVVQNAFVRWPDVHPGALADPREPFQFVDRKRRKVDRRRRVPNWRILRG